MMVCVCILFAMNVFFCIRICIVWKENKKIVEQICLLNDQCQRSNEKIATIQKLRHDISNHLYVMDRLAENRLTSRTYSYDPVIDSAICSKIEHGHHQKIEIICDIEKFHVKRIERVELLSLICNIWDNAIEACGWVCSLEKKWICFILKCEESGILVECMNSCNSEVKLKEGERTTKKDTKNHGLGNEIIKDIVSKYNGTMEVKMEPKSYSLRIKGLLL